MNTLKGVAPEGLKCPVLLSFPQRFKNVLRNP